MIFRDVMFSDRGPSVIYKVCKNCYKESISFDPKANPIEILMIVVVPLERKRMCRLRFASITLGQESVSYLTGYDTQVVYIGTCAKCRSEMKEEGPWVWEPLSLAERSFEKFKATQKYLRGLAQ